MTRKQIEYVTCIIGTLSQMTGLSCSLIYSKLHSARIIKDYLVAAYDVLHTLSLEYVAEDIIDLMRKDTPYVSIYQLCFITQNAIDRCLKFIEYK